MLLGQAPVQCVGGTVLTATNSFIQMKEWGKAEHWSSVALYFDKDVAMAYLCRGIARAMMDMGEEVRGGDSSESGRQRTVEKEQECGAG